MAHAAWQHPGRQKTAPHPWRIPLRGVPVRPSPLQRPGANIRSITESNTRAQFHHAVLPVLGYLFPGDRRQGQFAWHCPVLISCRRNAGLCRNCVALDAMQSARRRPPLQWRHLHPSGCRPRDRHSSHPIPGQSAYQKESWHRKVWPDSPGRCVRTCTAGYH